MAWYLVFAPNEWPVRVMGTEGREAVCEMTARELVTVESEGCGLRGLLKYSLYFMGVQLFSRNF